MCWFEAAGGLAGPGEAGVAAGSAIMTVQALRVDTAAGEAAFAGAPALEGYPVDTDVPGHTRNAFTGAAATFARHGFQVVARRKPDRPIMRLHLM